MSEAERDASAHLQWYRIAWNGVEGWTAGRFLGEGDPPPAMFIEMK